MILRWRDEVISGGKDNHLVLPWLITLLLQIPTFRYLQIPK